MVSKREKDKRKIRYTNAKEVAEKQQAGFELSSVSIPKDTSLFQFKREGLYKVDVIPFITKEGNPMADEGMVHYERTYYAHRGIGAEGKSYCCLKKTFHKKCPICEHLVKLEQEGADKETIDALRAKKRQLWAFVDLGEKDKGIQIHEAPYFNGLGEILDNKIDMTEEDDPYRNFFHLDGGMTLKIGVKQGNFNGRAFYQPTNIEMVPRKKPLDESILDEVPCLDDLPKELDYEELKSIFLQSVEDAEDEEDDEEESPKKKGNKKAKKEEPEEDDEDSEDEDSDNDSDEDDEENEDEEGTDSDQDEDEDDGEDSEEDDKGDEDSDDGSGKLPFAIGDLVTYKKMKCQVTAISKDKKVVTLEDMQGDDYKVKDLSLIKPEEPEEEPEPEEEKPVKKKRGRPRKNP